MSEFESDVVIVGSGPVGLFAVFECGMLKLSCHVVDALDFVGGQCSALYPEKPIYDIPGFPRVEAEELIVKLHEQASPFQPHYHLGQSVERLERLEDGDWRIQTSKGTVIRCKAVIIAAGSGAFGPNRPPLPGIEDYEGTSVHYLVRRREDFRGKRVTIAGGGDSAVDWAISLAEVAEKISIVHRRAKFRAAPRSVERLGQLVEEGKIELIVPCQLHSLEGKNGKLEAVVAASLKGEVRRIESDVLLPFFGLSMNLGPIADWGLQLDRGLLNIDPATCQTNEKGIYAIGDIVTYPSKLKLILCGFHEAAMAAHAIRAQIHPDEELHWECSTTMGLPGMGS